MLRSFVIKYTPTCVEKTGELIMGRRTPERRMITEKRSGRDDVLYVYDMIGRYFGIQWKGGGIVIGVVFFLFKLVTC